MKANKPAQCTLFSKSICNPFSGYNNSPNVFKKMHKGLQRFWNNCLIPEEEIYERAEVLALKARVSPADWLGRQSSCFFCIPMKLASTLICLFSFVWATLQIQNAEYLVGKFISTENEYFDVVAAIYSLFAFIFLIGSASLMLGILTNCYTPLHIYVWIAFCYNFLIMLTTSYNVMLQILEVKNRERYRPLAFIALAYVLFHSMVYYCIAVVNTLEVYSRMNAMIDFGT